MGSESDNNKSAALSIPPSQAAASEEPGPGAGDSVTSEDADKIYQDPTPRTPRPGVSPTRRGTKDDEGTDENGSNAEIQSIMEQFKSDGSDEPEDTCDTGPGPTSHPEPNTVQFPSRTSSLEPATSVTSPHQEIKSIKKFEQIEKEQEEEEKPTTDSQGFAHPNRVSSLSQISQLSIKDEAKSPSQNSPSSLSKIPPAPDPEPDLPFDFQRFLEQLRHRAADPVAKYLRSFLIEFGRKQWTVHEQVKLISDFLSFITNKMARCEVWRGISDAEFDNAKEGMEKLVMNRLYTQTFSPAIPPPIPSSGGGGKRKTNEKTLEPGRRGQHQEDVERDDILGQKVKIYGWVQEEHLDIPRVNDSGRRLLVLAQQELLKIRTYRAPRDKIICVLNCCKVIFGILRNSKSLDTSADSFVPLLIYVVLHANPDHLVSNVQYILRFRSPEKLSGEAGYYLSSLMGAIQFIENIDRTSLTISDQDFEKNVEAAVSAIAEKHQEEPKHPHLQTTWPHGTPHSAPHISEKSGLSQPEVAAQNSVGAEYSSPMKHPQGQAPSTDVTGRRDDNTAVSGLLRTIQRPLSNLGRVFSDEPGALPTLPEPQAPQRLSPAVFQPPPDGDNIANSSRYPAQVRSSANTVATPQRRFTAEEAAASQASAEAAEAQRIQRAEHENIVESVSSGL